MLNDSELLEVVTNFATGLLKKAKVTHAGNCLTMSEVLQWYLKTFFALETEIINVKVDGVNHYCLQYTHEKIIDATASQFPNMPKVYIGRWPTNYLLY